MGLFFTLGPYSQSVCLFVYTSHSLLSLYDLVCVTLPIAIV